MKKTADWKLEIDKLKWKESKIIPTTDSVTESKITKSKWYKTESNKIALKSRLNSKWNEISEVLRPTEPNIPTLIAHKYRIYPDKQTKILYNKAFGIQRVIRNKANGMIKSWIEKMKVLNDGCPEDERGSYMPSKKRLREWLIKNDSKFSKDNPWLLDVNYDLRDEAILNLLKDYKTGFASGKAFKIGYRTRKDDLVSCSLTIHKRFWYRGWWNCLVPKNYKCEDKRFNRYKNNMPKEIEDLIKQGYYPDSIDKLPKKLQHAAKIKRINGEYYICITMNPLEQKESKENLFVVDPGYRTVFTGINFKDNVLEEICVNPSKVITKRLEEISRLDSLVHTKKNIKVKGKIKEITVKVKGVRHRTRYNLKKRIRKERIRVKNLIKDLHKTVAKYLCENFSTILIPKLNFHKLGLRERKKELAQRISHCSFVDNLINKSKQYRNCKVVVVKEDYTSKMCSCCGSYNNELGPKKEFICPSCKVEIDRDMNAVYNILMKNLHEYNLKKVV